MPSDSEVDSQDEGRYRHHKSRESKHGEDCDEKSSKKKRRSPSRSHRSYRSPHSAGSKDAVRKRTKRSRRSRSRSLSNSPAPSYSHKNRDLEDKEPPGACHCLGVFGLSSYTEEKHLKDIFSQYGPLESIFIIYDRQSGRSKGYGFVYFKSTEDAVEARKATQGLELDGRPIRVDYSLTTQPHPPTPGRYLGRSWSYDRGYPGYGAENHGSRFSRYSGRSRRHFRHCNYFNEEDNDDDYNEDYYYRRPRRFSPYSRHCQ
ncbi:transformer-2 protein homolog alpha [Aplysia californica]|uniref:Transformer-2 protein homolog alpha n=1 Tax=Aplysia californica TaxID=6500 RepID=A0ABM0JBF1_APLCA|nr:transformer-2 protein homolog alpha [Aplysia californica]